MKKILLFTISAALFCGCVSQVQELEPTSSSATRIYASFGSAETKTFLDAGLHQHWQDGDEIAVAEEGRDGIMKFKYVGETPEGKGIFEADPSVVLSPSARKFAIYPFESAQSINGSTGVGTVTIPNSQHYAEDGFAQGSNLMLGEAAPGSNTLTFSNIGGYLIFRLYGDATIRSVELKTLIWTNGTANSNFPYAGGPSLTWSDFFVKGTDVLLDCRQGVKLGTTAETATEFWFVVPPCANMYGGFTLEIKDNQGHTIVKRTDLERPIERNVVHKVKPVQVSFPTTPNLESPDTDCYIPSAGGSVEVALLTNVAFDVRIPSGNSWLQYSSDENTVTFTAQASSDGNPRHADVSFVNEALNLECSIRVNQLQANPIIEVGTDYYLEGDAPETFTFKKLVSEWIDVNSDGFVYESYGSTESDILMGINYTGWPFDERECTVTFSCGGNTQTVTFHQESSQAIYDKERAALMALYNSTDGPNWTNNAGWGSDSPIWDWAGIMSRTGRRITHIELSSNNLSGSLPAEIGDLVNLEHLDLSINNLTGTIPSSIGYLSKLDFLSLKSNALEGSIPESFNNLLYLRSRNCWLSNNRLSGQIPPVFMNDPEWRSVWWSIMHGNPFSLEEVPLYPIGYNYIDLDGNTIESSAYYASHTYTALFNWRTWCVYSDEYLPHLKMAYNAFKDKGFAIVGFSDEDDITLIRDYVESHNIPWPNIQCAEFIQPAGTPDILVVDNTGRAVYATSINDSRWNLYYWLEGKLGSTGVDPLYSSTDFSADGTVHTLQTASEGDGINIILMGDAYSDRLIENGTYGNVMNQAMEAFFAEEPYSTYRNCFNVKYVDVVSKNEMFYGETALGTWYGEGTAVGGNNDTVFDYAQTALGTDSISDALIIVLMNRDFYAGTCYMFNIYDDTADFGRGFSVAYLPVSSDADVFGQVLRHEAGGHGFAKLADEYAYEAYGAIPQTEIDEVRADEPYGWWKNIDFTNNTTLVKWAPFIADARYTSQNIGCYEGAYTYWTGVWRPTVNSIMNDNTGGFNAPSRYAIWYRINKLAYPSRAATYEDFVTYDAVNISPAPAPGRHSRRGNHVEQKLPPLAPPVVLPGIAAIQD